VLKRKGSLAPNISSKEKEGTYQFFLRGGRVKDTRGGLNSEKPAEAPQRQAVPKDLVAKNGMHDRTTQTLDGNVDLEGEIGRREIEMIKTCSIL